MRRRSISSAGGAQASEINMSPLIDIVFILLIFFVVTTVFVEDPGVEIQKPQASTAQKVDQEVVILGITAESEVFYAGKNIGVDGVQSVVSFMLADNPEMPVVIQGDRHAKHGVIMKVTDAAKLAGAKQVFSAVAK
ncbi:ExbD/TolR family protein [Rubritalea marina]|uniref:ExbD/TolR family protein n=1 Tax=Rubritalea marina TaxID=361055 RepID=UPI0003796CE2|nr:biopolymer transporter ExbD [Rubritalea marina]